MKIKLVILLCGALVLLSCGSDNSRHSGEEYSFDNLISMALTDNHQLNGTNIVINSKVRTTFLEGCPPGIPVPCVDPGLIAEENFSFYERVNEYGHEDNSTLTCSAGNFILTSENGIDFEILDFGEFNYDEFLRIPEEVEGIVKFSADIEFVDRIDYCAKKIYKGVNVKVSDGEHEKIISQLFMVRQQNL